MHILTALKGLEKESVQRGIPIVGPLKGAWLLQQVQNHKPKKILELGTANGYSGSILASEGAELTSVEINPDLAEEAQDIFAELNLKVKVKVGDGIKEVKELVQKKTKFDLIFIDFAKHLYFAVLEDCLKLLPKNGLLIADNINMPGCKDFKEAILKDTRLKTELITIRDGMSLSVKK